MVRKGSRNISKSEPVITKVHWETLFTEIKTSVVFDVVTIRNWIIPHFKTSLKLLATEHNLAKYVAAASGKIGYRKMIFLDNLLRAPPKNKTPASSYMFKVNNRNTRTRCEICSKLIIKKPERRHRRLCC